MKTIIHLFSLAATFAVASAAGGYINSYTVANCVDASLPVTVSTSPAITQNMCAKLNTFLSFKGGVLSPCPKGQTPEVLAFRSDDCSGSGITAGSLPANQSPSACQDIITGDVGSGVKAGGHSAKFICVAA